MVKAILLKPLDGNPKGAEVEFNKTDFEMLEAMGAVKESKAPENKAAEPPANKSAPRKKVAE